mmetsp:Transcript_106184/g.257956  ORF Transcript_106184/g.257956 Transcript_106184/m.257956 type:complete len:342 (-) Transcript_106184:90-1115(-)
MDSLTAQPIYHSSLAAEEFEDLSGEEEADEGAFADENLDPAPLDLRERYVRPRFDGLVAKQAKGDVACRGVLRDMYDRLKVSNRDVVMSSSVRTYTLDFVLANMQGHYEQRSQADTASAIWAPGSNGVFEPAPNLDAELLLDGESLLGSRYFAVSSQLGRRWTDEQRLSDRFGSENLNKLGGVGTLLQFLGAICADCGAPYYAERLPFGLQEALLALEVDEEAEAAARQLRAHRASPESLVPSAPPKPRPSASVTSSTVVAPSTGARRGGSRPPAPPSGSAGPVKSPSGGSLATLTLAPPTPSAHSSSKGMGSRPSISPSPSKPREGTAPRRPRGSSRGPA